MSLKVALLLFAVLPFILQPCQGSGKIEIEMKRYQSSCTDNFGFSECDTFFYLCIDKPGNVSIDSCDYKRFGPSSYYEDTNNMDFGDHVGGIPNPMTVTVRRFETNQVMFVVEAMDSDVIYDDHLVTMGKNVSYTTAMKKSDTRWNNAYMCSGSYHVRFAHRSYCDADYYTSQCDVYCKARDDRRGHYTCNERTGEKQCMRGWKGDDCDTDINE